MVNVTLSTEDDKCYVQLVNSGGGRVEDRKYYDQMANSGARSCRG